MQVGAHRLAKLKRVVGYMHRLSFDPPCGGISSAGAPDLCVVNKILPFRLSTVVCSSQPCQSSSTELDTECTLWVSPVLHDTEYLMLYCGHCNRTQLQKLNSNETNCFFL
jgi:hypothetical protein